MKGRWVSVVHSQMTQDFVVWAVKIDPVFFSGLKLLWFWTILDIYPTVIPSKHRCICGGNLWGSQGLLGS